MENLLLPTFLFCDIVSFNREVEMVVLEHNGRHFYEFLSVYAGGTRKGAPIKKSSWCDTRHQVVFRWLTSGKCKTTGFDYDETSHDDELFKACLGKTLDIAVDSATKSA